MLPWVTSAAVFETSDCSWSKNTVLIIWIDTVFLCFDWAKAGFLRKCGSEKISVVTVFSKIGSMDRLVRVENNVLRRSFRAVFFD